MIDLFNAAPHARLHRGRTFVIKLGGAPLARAGARATLARQIALIHSLGSRVVVVHGGGPQTTEVERLLGGEPRVVDGRRVTSELSLRALRMAAAGELHGTLIAALDAAGVPAVGVAGASSGLLVAARRKPVVTSEGEVDFGLVGDVLWVDAAPLRALLDAGHVPVVSPPASDGEGGLLNVNADLAAAKLAVSLGAAKLVLATGAAGILEDPADPRSLYSALSLAQLNQLEASGALVDGMHVKSVAIRTALEGGVERVHVVSGTDEEALVRELYTNQGAGTLVTRETESAPGPGSATPASAAAESAAAESAAAESAAAESAAAESAP